MSDAKVPSDLDSIQNEIAKVKLEFDTKVNSLQTQLDDLKKDVDGNDEMSITRFRRVTKLIGSAMDHIRVIVQMVIDMHNKITEYEEQISRHGKSLAVNKKNIAELSKYVKQVDALWKEARKDITSLSEEAAAHKQFRWKLTAAISSILSAATYFGADWIKKFWSAIFPS